MKCFDQNENLTLPIHFFQPNQQWIDVSVVANSGYSGIPKGYPLCVQLDFLLTLNDLIMISFFSILSSSSSTSFLVSQTRYSSYALINLNTISPDITIITPTTKRKYLFFISRNKCHVTL